jgi:3'-phosphoadenosine 5'-phosphosulfate (PAPS) 3'-phosphatase
MDITTAVAQVRQAAADVEQAVEAVDRAREALQRAALRALVDAGDDAAMRELLHQLYWNVPELPVKTLEAVVGGGARVRQLAGPGPVIGACTDCDTAIHASSRTHMTTRPTCCTSCKSARERARRAQAMRSINGGPWDDDGSPGPVPAEWYDTLEPPDEDWPPV